MKKLINTYNLTDEQRDAFIHGWEDAGGYMGDLESPAPWCAPWTYAETITVNGETPEEWGADWWCQCEEEYVGICFNGAC